MEAGKVMQRAVILAVIYWIAAAVRSSILVEDMGFFQALYSGGTSDLIVRLLFVLLILGAGWKVKQFLGEMEMSAEAADADNRNAENALDRLGAATVILDQRGVVRQVNESTRTLLGKSLSDLQGKKFVDLYAAPGSQETVQQLLDSSRTGRGSTVGIQLIGNDGRHLDTAASASPYQTHAMDEPGTLLVLTDTSSVHQNLRRAEKTIENSRQALAEAKEPIAVLNSELELEWCSSSLSEGDDSMSWIEKNFTVPQRTSVETSMQAALADEQITELSFTLAGRSYLGLAVPFRDGQNEAKLLLLSVDTQTLQDTMAAEQRKLQQLQEDMEERRQEINELEEQINQLNRERADMEGEKDRLSAALEQSESEVRVQQQREDAVEEELKTCRARIEELETAQHRLEEERNSVDQDKNGLEDRLRETEQSKQQLADKLHSWRQLPVSADIPWVLVESGGQLRQASAGLEELIGRSGNEIASDGIEALLVDEEDREQHRMDLDNVLKGQRAPVRMVQVQAAEKVITAVTAMQLHQEVGEQPLVWVTVLPVNELRGERDEWKARAEAHQVELDNLLEEMETERDRFHGVIQGVDQGVVLTDVYHRVLQMNRAAEDVLNVRLSEVLDRPVRFAVRDPKYTNELERTLSERLRRHSFVLDPESTGLEQSLDLSASVVENKSGKAICVVTRIALR